MTAFRIEVDGPCVVTLTHSEQGVIRQEIHQGERVLHVAEFSALQGAARASAPPPDEAAGPPEGWAEDAEEGYAAALAGPVRLEPSRAPGRPRPAPAAPRPREI